MAWLGKAVAIADKKAIRLPVLDDPDYSRCGIKFGKSEKLPSPGMATRQKPQPDEPRLLSHKLTASQNHFPVTRTHVAVAYSDFRPWALAFAQRAFAAAAIFALAAALILRLGFWADLPGLVAAWILAHRARAAAAILALLAALIFQCFRGAGAASRELPGNWFSSRWSDSILSLMSAARRN
jgi:hypothetical protein